MKHFLTISAFILFVIVIFFTKKIELLIIGWIMLCTAIILDKIDEK